MTGRNAIAIAMLSAALTMNAPAETGAEPTDTCPAGAVSIYFAPSETLPSDETVDLIGRVGGLASSCEAEGIDVVAWVDPGEGASGMLLALERLRLVAERLVESGVNSARMRVGASVLADAPTSGPGSRNVRIILREGAAVRRADSPPPLVHEKPAVPPNAV